MKTLEVEGITIKLSPHSLVKGWVVAVAGTFHYCTTRAYVGEPTDEDLKALVKHHNDHRRKSE